MGILRQIYVRMTGEQQLLNENKERSGDTRAIRQNRTHRKSEADKQVAPAPTKLGGPAAVKAEDEDESRRRSSRVNNSSREEELSAQRRKKKFSVFGIWGLVNNIIQFESLPGSIFAVAAPFQATQSARVRTLHPFPDTLGNITNVSFPTSITTRTEERLNKYSYSTRITNIKFVKQETSSQTLLNTPVHTETGALDYFDWTSYQSDYPHNYQQVNGVTVTDLKYVPVATQPPQLLPSISQWLVDKSDMSTSTFYPLITCDGRYIYYSTMYYKYRPNLSFTSNVRKYESNVSPLITPHGTLGFSLPFYERFTEYVDRLEAYQIFNQSGGVGLYWVFDTKTQNSSLRTESLNYQGDGTYRDERTPATNFLEFLSSNDPIKASWLAYRNLTDVFSLRTLGYNFLERDLGWSAKEFIVGLVYYPDTGLAIYTGNLKQQGVLRGTTIYTKTLTPGRNVRDVHLYALPAPNLDPAGKFSLLNTSHEDMLNSGWKAETTLPPSPLTSISGLFAVRPT